MLTQILYRLRRRLLSLLRIRTRGVKVLVFNGTGELLLVRNSYGSRHLYVLPGGGIRPFETPAAAAARELREEAGTSVEGLSLLSVYSSRAEGKRDTIHLFTGRTTDRPRPDGVEVVEARFFSLDRLPETVSPATLRRIAEFRGKRPIGADW